MACEAGHFDVVRTLIIDAGACPSFPNWVSAYVLGDNNVSVAATKILQRLYMSYVQDGNTPLHFACLKGHLHIVQFLILSDASLNTPDYVSSLHFSIIESSN